MAEAEKLLENQHLEYADQIDPLASCIALAVVRIAMFQQWPE